MDQPRAIVTLKIADEGDKRIYVTEFPAQVRDAIIAAAREPSNGRLVTLHRVKGSRTVEFSTQPANIVNVEDAA